MAEEEKKSWDSVFKLLKNLTPSKKDAKEDKQAQGQTLKQRVEYFEKHLKYKKNQLGDIKREIQRCPLSERRELYKTRFIKLGDVRVWQTTCPQEKRLTLDSNISKADEDVSREVNSRIALWSGNIVELEVDAVVDTNTYSLESSPGTTSAEFDRMGGPLYRREVKKLETLPEGMLRITGGYRLPARYVIHVNGPHGHLEKDKQRHDLASCYIECLEAMKMLGCRSMAFPCISTGGKGISHQLAVSVAMTTVRDWLTKNYHLVDMIIFCTYDSYNCRLYEEKMPMVFPVYAGETETLSQNRLPPEILRMDSRSVEMYKRALADGHVSVHNIRVMLVGHSGVGKTTLLNRLLNRPVKINERESTDGIEVHVRQCKVDLDTGQWIISEGDTESSGANLLASTLPKILHSLSSEDASVDHKPIQESGVSFEPVLEAAASNLSAHKDNDDDLDVDARPVSSTDETTIFDLSISGDHQPPSPEMSNADKEHLKHLNELVQAQESVSDVDYANVSFWDFAGQSIFYNTHQVFLAHRTIYLLVTNMEETFDTVVTAGDNAVFENYGKNVKDFVDFWVNSIHFFCGEENKKGPPVILVASHADKQVVQSRDHFKNVRDIFGGKVTAKHIMNDLQFPIDNTRQDETLERLKESIFEIAKQQDYWGEQQPARWIVLEEELDKLRQDGTKIVRVTQVEDINKRLPVPLKGLDEIKLFLKFQNDIGNVLFISEAELQDNVLLDPQWVANALKSIITAEEFLDKKMEFREIWKMLKETGILTMDIIDAAWGRPDSTFKPQKNFLLLLMQRLNLIAHPEDEVREHSDMTDHYFVPCFITKNPRDLPTNTSPQSSSVLTLTVPSRFFPVVIFNKVIASCIKRYSLMKTGQSYCIYNGCAVFCERDACVFTLFYIDNRIKVWVTSYSQRYCAKSMSTVCHSVLSFLKKSIQDNLKDERQKAVVIYASCPKLYLRSVQESLELKSNINEWKNIREQLCGAHDGEEPHALSKEDLLRNWIPCDSVDNEESSSCCPDLSRRPTSREIAKMSGKIGKEYKRLGILLDIATEEMEQIQMDNPHNVKEQIFEMLQRWKAKKGQDATLARLSKHMQEIDLDSHELFGECLDS